MKNSEFFAELDKYKIAPVVKLNRAEDALPLAEALKSGGLPVAEITFRTDAAETSILAIATKYSDMLVGAGTIISVEQAKRAVGAGAKFLVSPGFNQSVAEYAVKQGVPVIPGCCTPTEIIAAMEMNLDVVKFFPSNVFGGLNTIRNYAPVFPSMRFMPTGGINIDNLAEYLADPAIIAVGGSWMVKEAYISDKNFAKITQLTKEAVETANKAK
ncbi:MAG: bifunctional 4-hydroxy-2-oxoglutarate aldolase/2-dehydro-3-deoxy-phosphogluconate aldolase [Oscillospiraceae bacterium]|nr:bifunctional 4-hydroxy-2-oxoglutarate aldolase/2-dehydro-3-deoxy-phosphogluconate aldolase [Oscillospiraceae bacterium]